MDIQRSFSFVFQDKNWLVKVIIGGIVNLIPILNFASIGYQIETVQAVKNREETLPEWSNFGQLFVNGLVFSIGMFIYVFIPLLLIFFTGGLAAFRGGFMMQDSTFLGGLTFLVLLLCTLYLIALGFFYPAIFLNFARKRTLSAMFEFKEILQSTFSRLNSYILCWVTILIALFAISFFSAIPVIGFPLGFFAGFYFGLVISGAVGQLWAELEADSNVI